MNVRRMAKHHLALARLPRRVSAGSVGNVPKARPLGRIPDYDYYLVANNAFFQRPEMQPLLEDFTT
jgi:hypothetical protein